MVNFNDVMERHDDGWWFRPAEERAEIAWHIASQGDEAGFQPSEVQAAEAYVAAARERGWLPPGATRAA